MYKESANGNSSMSSRKGDEVELVSRFLAPLCARDEAARNLALAAARSTVEGWLDGGGSGHHRPNNNNWPDAPVDLDERYERSGSAAARMKLALNANYRSDSYFPRGVLAVGERPTFDASLTPERYPSGSFDCVDGMLDDGGGGGAGGKVVSPIRMIKESESSERKLRATGRQKQFEQEDKLDADTRVYGKSPKFDDGLGNFEFARARAAEEVCEVAGGAEAENVVFNTLEGFLNEKKSSCCSSPERKVTSAGQTKRPLSQDGGGGETVWKTGRIIVENPAEVVTPGDVGRMLNLGNALDGPRQAQPNKYLSLVSLHLPVILRLSVNCPFKNVRTKCAEIIQMIKDRGLPVPEPPFDGPSAFVPVTEVTRRTRSSILIMAQMLLQEPGWKLERKGSALLLMRDNNSGPQQELQDERSKARQRVCFRCDVEVREYERDEDYQSADSEPVIPDVTAASPLAMCASCLAAICVTVLLPWLLIGP